MVGLVWVMRLQVIFILVVEVGSVRWITNNRVESSGFHRVGKALLPVKCIDALHFFGFGKKPAGEVVRADQRIAALDVVCEVRQSAVAKWKLAQGKALVSFTFQHL